ncbi:Protein HYPER-SENSITIVITY-RELATED 4, partial [Linum perenne]
GRSPLHFLLIDFTFVEIFQLFNPSRSVTTKVKQSTLFPPFLTLKHAMASSAETNLATAKTVLSTAASVAATVMLARTIAQDFIPDELHHFVISNLRKFFTRFSSELTMVVDEYNGIESNQIYAAAEIYLAGKVNSSTQRLNVSQLEKETQIQVRMESEEEVTDEFHGVKFRWVLVSTRTESTSGQRRQDTFLTKQRSFFVSFLKKHKSMALELYFPYIVREAKSLNRASKSLKISTIKPENLYGNMSEVWGGVNLDHPATFDTLAMDAEMKNMVLKDLDRFLKRRDYYRKVGKAWKRGYLLYGPPGTGKSSLIAAMANYIHFDIYDLELTQLSGNSELRRLLIATPNRSILVVEDIDCTIDLQDRERVTLSGLLNFIDGLWSSCGDERIIVFTTNHKEKLDPALLRPGRMDLHINLSYCTPCGFRILASNYLGIKEHELFGEIEEMMLGLKVTPAEVAEQLMRNDEADHGNVLSVFIEFLKMKKIGKEAEECVDSGVKSERD